MIGSVLKCLHPAHKKWAIYTSVKIRSAKVEYSTIIFTLTMKIMDCMRATRANGFTKGNGNDD